MLFSDGLEFIQELIAEFPYLPAKRKGTLVGRDFHKDVERVQLVVQEVPVSAVSRDV